MGTVTIDVKTGPVPKKYSGENLDEALTSFKTALENKRSLNKTTHNMAKEKVTTWGHQYLNAAKNLGNARGQKNFLKTTMNSSDPNNKANYNALKAKTTTAKQTLKELNKNIGYESELKKATDERKKTCGWKKGWFGWTKPDQVIPGCEDLYEQEFTGVKKGGVRKTRRNRK
jgi:hypothetical protein